MELKETSIQGLNLPSEISQIVCDAKVFDSSCSDSATTLFIDKDCGYFLKISDKDTLKQEAVMTDYLWQKELSARVVKYFSDEKDYLVTEKIDGFDGLDKRYLDDPKRLSEVFAQSLIILHDSDTKDCPYKNRIFDLAKDVEINIPKNDNAWLLKKYTDFTDKNSVLEFYKKHKHRLKNDVIIHGDYCLPNILLKDFKFSGFIDLGYGGLGDRHYDISWALWTMKHNFKTDAYSQRFLDVYGKDKIELEMIKVSNIIAAFG